MGLKVNPETDGEGGFAGCSAGRKLVHAVGMRRWEASTGTAMLTVGFVVLRDGAKTGDETKVFMERFACTQAAIFRMARWAKATGWKKEFDAENDNDLQRIMAHGPLVVVLKEREYKGKKSVEVEEFAAYTGQTDPAWDGVVKAGEEEFEVIQRRMEEARAAGDGGSSSAGDSGNGSTGKGSQGGPAPYDDIPF